MKASMAPSPKALKGRGPGSRTLVGSGAKPRLAFFPRPPKPATTRPGRRGAVGHAQAAPPPAPDPARDCAARAGDAAGCRAAFEFVARLENFRPDRNAAAGGALPKIAGTTR